ncbi:MAG: hypothetical protein HN576_15325 [Bacteriovoracaceae bacterium]|jgi:hypothetical protein|nr:hypothetical protein [Bacteriovoracaceae bacterium]
MKQLFKNINKTSLFITLIVHLMAYKVHALDSVAIVNDIKGTVFVSAHGKTAQLNIGDEILLGSEILTTAGGTVSLTDYYDHQFHLSNSSHVKLKGDTIQLRSGYLWMQSYRKIGANSPFKITTANSISKYTYGESILSFDPVSTKTQLLVIKGKFIFQNIQNELDQIYVEDGLFSYIKTDQNKGGPRASTPVGFSSFKKITSLFNRVAPMGSIDHIVKRENTIAKMNPTLKTAPEITPSWKKTSNKREIASSPIKSGNIIYIHGSKKSDSRFLSKQLKYLGKKHNIRKKKKKVFKHSKVTVRIYGADFKLKKVPASVTKVKETIKRSKPVIKVVTKKVKALSIRAPASTTSSSTQLNDKGDAFEKGLKKAYKKQTRHSPEINSLIHDLKNYDQDFKTAY